jgi:gas vesicle protein
MSDEQQNSNFMIGFLIGSSLSTIVALMFHPHTGAQTRKILGKTAQALPQLAQDFSSTLQIHTHNLSLLANKKWQRTLHRLQVAIKAGVEASRNLED